MKYIELIFALKSFLKQLDEDGFDWIGGGSLVSQQHKVLVYNGWFSSPKIFFKVKMFNIATVANELWSRTAI